MIEEQTGNFGVKYLMRITKSKLLLLVGILFTLFPIPPIQGQKTENKVITWEDKVFEKTVDYGSFACEETATKKEIVSEFFKSHPLIPLGTGSYRLLSVCHNNCAVLKSFHKRSLSFLHPKTRGNGSIAIHVLVNKKGEPIFARALNGHKVVRWMLQRQACKSEFLPTPQTRQSIIFVCVGDKCDAPQPVQ